MVYDIAWVKELSKSDLVMCNLLTFMCIYRYNIRYEDIRKNIILTPAEAKGITRIVIKLRTKSGNLFTTPPYYIPDDEAELFVEKLVAYYEARRKEDT